jgi:hypothetical protein
MQLTTILAVLFSCLVVFISVGYTDSSLIQGKHPLNYRNPFIESQNNPAVRHRLPFKNGRPQFASRAIVESLKQRRKRS